jgi:hypothetical protein
MGNGNDTSSNSWMPLSNNQIPGHSTSENPAKRLMIAMILATAHKEKN